MDSTSAESIAFAIRLLVDNEEAAPSKWYLACVCGPQRGRRSRARAFCAFIAVKRRPLTAAVAKGTRLSASGCSFRLDPLPSTSSQQVISGISLETHFRNSHVFNEYLTRYQGSEAVTFQGWSCPLLIPCASMALFRVLDGQRISGPEKTATSRSAH